MEYVMRQRRTERCFSLVHLQSLFHQAYLSIDPYVGPSVHTSQNINFAQSKKVTNKWCCICFSDEKDRPHPHGPVGHPRAICRVKLKVGQMRRCCQVCFSDEKNNYQPLAGCPSGECGWSFASIIKSQMESGFYKRKSSCSTQLNFDIKNWLW